MTAAAVVATAAAAAAAAAAAKNCRCLKKIPHLGESCMDIEGNVEPNESCEGPSGQQGLCFQPSGNRWLMWSVRPNELITRAR
jgi:hypothetical protein